MRSRIVGTGSYAPSTVLTNADLEAMVPTSGAWIVERTGIRERHLAADGEATSDLALQASRRALEQAGVGAADLDLVVVGTVTPDLPWPATAALLQHGLGARGAFAFDVSAGCAGSLYALSVADRFVASGAVRRALVVGADTLSRIVDWQDRRTCVLFGDGAGAMVVVPERDGARGIASLRLFCDGSLSSLLHQPGGGSRRPPSAQVLAERSQFIAMNGSAVSRFALRALVDAAREALAAAGLSPRDVDHVVAHQASTRILAAVLERLEIPLERAWITVDRHGNTSSAGLPTALDEANRAGRLRPGDAILVMALGAGIAWGAGVVRW